MVLAIALRAAKLAVFPFEQDELYTIWEGRDLFNVDLRPGIHARPLYFLIQHLLLEVLPPTPLAVRALPFIFGIAGVWLTWKVAADLFGYQAGLVAATLLAISPWHVHASGFARYWSLVYLLSLAFCYLLLRAYTSNRPRMYWFALLVLITGSATHPSFVITAASITLALTLVNDEGRLGWRWPPKTAWLNLWLPYVFFLALAGLALTLADRGSALQNWSGRGFMASLRLVPAVIELTNPAVALAGLLGAVFTFRVGSTPARRRWGGMTLIACMATLLLLFYASTRSDVYSDYALPILPIIVIAAAAGTTLISERLRSASGWIVTGCAAVLAFAVLPATFSHLSDGTRFDYRPALDYIARHDPSLAVLTWPLVTARHYAPHLNTYPLSNQPAKLDRELSEHHSLWVISSALRFGIVTDDAGEVARWLSRRCTLEQTFERPRWDYRLYRVQVHRCQNRPAVAVATSQHGLPGAGEKP